jgi:hypothetical protein
LYVFAFLPLGKGFATGELLLNESFAQVIAAVRNLYFLLKLLLNLQPRDVPATPVRIVHLSEGKLRR